MKPLRIRQSTSTGDNNNIQCGSGGAPVDYNLGLHVGALFIILFVSATGCSFPLIITKFPRLRIPASFLFFVRHFGTGVLLATAFVHLIPTAFISMTDPCLPKFWNETYPAMAGAIALSAVFFITTVEMVFSPGRHGCSADVSALVTDRETKAEKQDTAESQLSKGPLYGRSLSGRSHSNARQIVRLQTTQQSEEPDNIAAANEDTTDVDQQNGTLATRSASLEIEDSKSLNEAEVARKKALMQCMMLEMGILFHSVFIGMALAVATGSDQIVLLIAIIFHQTFEGLALGSRIASITFPPGSLQPWIMALLYGFTTPLGQALGIATRSLYSPDSQTGLLVVGIFNAISSGFLTFNSLVDLLSEDFLSDASWQGLRGGRRIWAFGWVFAGAFCMAVVGAWA